MKRSVQTFSLGNRDLQFNILNVKKLLFSFIKFYNFSFPDSAWNEDYMDIL